MALASAILHRDITPRQAAALWQRPPAPKLSAQPRGTRSLRIVSR